MSKHSPDFVAADLDSARSGVAVVVVQVVDVPADFRVRAEDLEHMLGEKYGQ